MSRSTGPGVPLVFRCARCKVGRNWKTESRRGMKWMATGEIRAKVKRGSGPRTDRNRQAEYRCLDCGWTGWSRHRDVIEAADAKKAKRVHVA